MQYPPNYGQYGPGPYGYGVNAYGPPPGTNGMAIASLVLGICGFFCVTPFIGLGLGIAALVQTSKTRQAGRGMAIAGIILSVAWILLAVLLIATAHFHINEGGTGSGPTQDPNGTSA
jgi:ABC-type dipeptide/oligopeptide/nickel transport system permease component